MCKHSELYQIENEQYGGVGCPRCKSVKARREALEAVLEAQGNAQAPTPVCFDAGACNAGVCVDCYGDCDELAAIEAAAIADWRDDFESQARPGAM